MKMEINIKIIDNDGIEIIRPVVIDTEIPEFDEFKDSTNFREIFDKYEKAVLKARNTAAELASEEFLSELSKKKQLNEKKQRKE
jgi:hypothetical protein